MKLPVSFAAALLATGLGLSAAAASEARLVNAPFPPARPADLALQAPAVEPVAVVVEAPLPPRRPDGLGEPVRTLASIDARR